MNLLHFLQTDLSPISQFHFYFFNINYLNFIFAFTMWKILGLALAVFICSTTMAQKPSSGKLKVFIDCRVGCDFNYFKSEISIIDFIRDRVDADAYVMLTAQRMGGGGVEYNLNFYGQGIYKDYTDTLMFTTEPNATAMEVRKSLLQYIMLGFSPLIVKTDYVLKAENGIKKQDDSNATATVNEVKDPWNFWVFSVAARGQFNADQVYKNSVFGSDLYAGRVTHKLKVGISLNGSLNNSFYKYDATQYTVKNSNYRLYHTLVKSFSDHWSYGYQTIISNSTFDNYKLKLSFNPAIEYNVFKYNEVNNRFFVLRYGAFGSQNDYYDTTIFNLIKQSYLGHRFSGAITLNKKWGTFNGGLFYANYLYDWALYTTGLNANTDVRIGSGLSFFVNLNASIVHNQVNLVKGNITEQELLTRQRQLGSTFNYNTSFGLAYRFGSILNNFVNPRFEGYGGF